MEKSSITKFYVKASISLLILLTITSFKTAMGTTYLSTSTPTVYANPLTYHATHLGETFQINISIADVESNLRLIGAEFRLRYNATLLDTLDEWFVEGDFFKSVGQTFSQGYIHTDSEGRKYVHAFVLLLPSDVGVYSDFPQGNGILATLSFQALYRPMEPERASCELELHDIILVDADLNAMTPKKRSGTYSIDSLPRPILEVNPEEHIAMRSGETFEVNVNLEDVDSDLHLVGLQFKLRYNASLLETKPQWIGEGDFLKAYGSTWFQALVESDHVLVGIMILPGETGGWQGPFPQGEGAVLTLKFKTIYQPIEPETAISGLILADTILVDYNTDVIAHDTSDGEVTILSASSTIDQYRPIDVQLDVGSLHFAGEIADFYALVADYGKAVDADNIDATLYFEGAEYMNLKNEIVHISKGLYRIPYTIPADSEAGTYLLMVRAEYANVSGTAIRSFLISSTLDNWNSTISNIENNIAAVIIPSVGQIKLDLAAINATLVSVEDGVATIETSVGTLTTSISNLNTKITKIDGDIATVQTDLGTIEARVSDVSGNAQTSVNLLYVAIALSLVAVILAAIAVFNTRKKQPTPT